jgi:hypothetical protein
MYTGIFNPQIILDETIKIYTNGNLYHEFIDANHNNP